MLPNSRLSKPIYIINLVLYSLLLQAVYVSKMTSKKPLLTSQGLDSVQSSNDSFSLVTRQSYYIHFD